MTVFSARRFRFGVILGVIVFIGCAARSGEQAAFSPDKEYQADQAALEQAQRDAFAYFWEDGDPDSGMAYEATYEWEPRPIAVGGTGFGIAAMVAAVDRGWISREDATTRLRKIVLFLRDKTPRKEFHGAFPHWLDGTSGQAMAFGQRDAAADIVETSLLMQGLLIARAYFNGPGVEEKAREVITELWEGVEWDWFTNGEENGLYWHWDPRLGFSHGLKILGYNECLVTYVLAASSPTHPISRPAYDYWTSGVDYLPRIVSGYEIEASCAGGGPLFMTQYSFIGLNPKKLADAHVRKGYFVRGAKQTLSNRGYCLYEAPPENKYSEAFWGLSACHTKAGYAACAPLNDHGTVAPTAAISSMPFTPHYSLQVLRNLTGGLRKRVWGERGPYDGISLRDEWVSEHYLAIDQLPMTCMIENYRTGLLWNLFMGDKDIRNGLAKAGLAAPAQAEGFPEAVVTLLRDGGGYAPDAYEIRRHPDSGLYEIPYFVEAAGKVSFSIADYEGEEVWTRDAEAVEGGNVLTFPQFMPKSDEILTLLMKTARGEYSLPLRLH